MTWERGRDAVERLVADGELERVVPSREVADRLVGHAGTHLRLASTGADDDPAAALQLAYDPARKESSALLAMQGLRATTRGWHIAVLDAVRVQFGDAGGMPIFGRINRLRRRRNAAEYAADGTPGVTPEDVQQALAIARHAVEAAKRLLDTGRLDPFD